MALPRVPAVTVRPKHGAQTARGERSLKRIVFWIPDQSAGSFGWSTFGTTENRPNLESQSLTCIGLAEDPINGSRTQSGVRYAKLASCC